MSKLTRCNYCQLKDIREEAHENGEIVIVHSGNVYVLQEGEELDTRSPDEGNKQWKAWMMEIPERCVC